MNFLMQRKYAFLERISPGPINFLFIFTEAVTNGRPFNTMEKITENNIHASARLFTESGAVLEAGRLLGHAVFLEGLVVEGNRIGRTLGYPTANLRPADQEQVVPAQGVYVGMVKVGGHWYESMINIGIRPTLDLENVTIEAHLFDFDENIYGEYIGIHFLDRIRDEMRFPSLGALKDQLQKDRSESLQKLREMNLQPDASEELIFLKKEGN